MRRVCFRVEVEGGGVGVLCKQSKKIHLLKHLCNIPHARHQDCTYKLCLQKREFVCSRQKSEGFFLPDLYWLWYSFHLIYPFVYKPILYSKIQHNLSLYSTKIQWRYFVENITKWLFVVFTKLFVLGPGFSYSFGHDLWNISKERRCIILYFRIPMFWIHRYFKKLKPKFAL